MNKGLFQQTLQELAAQALPATLDLRTTILTRAARQPVRKPFTHPLTWTGVLLAAALVIGATAYASSPVIYRLLTMDDSLKNFDPATEGQPLDLTQTLGPLTVNLQWAYADADRVMLGYTVQSSDGRRFDPYGVLVDPTGAISEAQGGYGVTGQSDILQVNLPPGEGSYVETFPACTGEAAIPNEKGSLRCYPIPADSINGTLALHFTVQAYEQIIPTAAPVTPEASAPISTSAEAQPATVGEQVGPFTFDFTTPVKPSSQTP